MKKMYIFICCLLSIQITFSMEKDAAPPYSSTASAPFGEPDEQQHRTLQQLPPRATGNTTLQVFVGGSSSTVIPSTDFHDQNVSNRTNAWKKKELPGKDTDQKLRYRTTGPLPTGAPAHARHSNISEDSSSGCSSARNTAFESEENESGEEEEEYPDDMEVLPGSGITFSGRTDELLAALKDLCNAVYQQATTLHQKAQENGTASNGVVATYRTQQYKTSPTGFSKLLPGSTERHANNVATRVQMVEELQDAAQRKQTKHFRAAMVAAFARLAKIQESMGKRAEIMDLRATQALEEIQASCTSSSMVSPLARRRTLSGGATSSPGQLRKNSVSRSTSISPSILSSSPSSTETLLQAGKVSSPREKKHERKKSDTTMKKPWEKK